MAYIDLSKPNLANMLKLFES